MLGGVTPGQTQQVVVSGAGEHGGVGGLLVLPTHASIAIPHTGAHAVSYQPKVSTKIK
jgi:hypothetical protein